MTKTIINALRICPYRKSYLEVLVIYYEEPDGDWDGHLQSPELGDYPDRLDRWAWYDDCVGKDLMWPEDYD